MVTNDMEQQVDEFTQGWTDAQSGMQVGRSFADEYVRGFRMARQLVSA